MKPYVLILGGILFMCGAFMIDSAECGGRVMSADEQCTTVHLGESRSYTRNYDEQRNSNNWIRILCVIMGGVIVAGGVVQIIDRK
jgi:hypothetical protein